MKTGTIQLEIERIVAGGYGLARAPEGVVLIRGALPGERVTARPRESGGVLRAHAIDILAPHPKRVDLSLPPGADLPMEYAAQLPIKQALVQEAVSRVGKFETDLQPIVASPVELGYRTAAQYVVLQTGGLGARAQGSDRVVELQRDPLLAPPLVKAFEACNSRLLSQVTEVVFRGSLYENKVLVGLIGDRSGPFARHARALTGAKVAGVIWGEDLDAGRFRGRSKHLDGKRALIEDMGGVMVSVGVESFSQVNPAAASLLFQEVAKVAGAGSKALDLYAGSGVLGMHLSKAFAEVIAVEISPEAVRRGRQDARRLGLSNLSFEQADVRTVSRFFPADSVVVDPPRAGLSQATIALLALKQPQRIVYVSCNPSTWARDVAALKESGYELEWAKPFDFYPYTHHVEVLSVLKL